MIDATHPVDPQAAIVNLPGVRDLGLAELLVERRGAEPLVIIILDGHATRGRRGLRGGSKPQRSQEGAAYNAEEGAAGWVHGNHACDRSGC